MFIIAIPLASFAEGNRTVTILYTGSVKGTIDPCSPAPAIKTARAVWPGVHR